MARQKAGNTQIQSDSVVEFSKPNQAFDGHFLGTNKFQGNYGPSTAHIFLGEDGKTHCIYGTKVLDDLMSEIAIGTHTWVVYKGKKKTKNGNMAKIWDVEFDSEDVLDADTLAAATALAESEDSEDEAEEDEAEETAPADEQPVAKSARTNAAKPTSSSAEKMNNLLKNRRAAQ